jgi:FMN phosphatase YigB (HAD superfamily)
MKMLTAQEVLDAYPSATLLSLDFFDTLVTRSVAQPTHVFAEMERRLMREFGRQWKGFARIRVDVEHECRVALDRISSSRDVTHDEIIDALRKHYGTTEEMAKHLQQLECDCEIEMASPVPFGADVARLALERGMKVIIVSDNYMPSQHLVRMAHAAGLAWVQEEHVFVSCEHGGMKHNGSLWKTVLSAVGVPAKNILHVGDHKIPDEIEPRKLGINCYIDSRSSQWHRHSLNTTPAVVPFSRIEASQRNSAYESFSGVAAHLGGGVVAMMVAAQIKDCVTAVRSRDIAGLHFAARDGWMAHNTWHQLRTTWIDLPEASYLSFSRSVVGRANIKKVDEKVAIRFIDEHELLTPRRLSSRFGCNIQSSFADDEVLDSATARQLVMDNSDQIVAASQQLRQRLVGYLGRSGLLSPGHHIVVDLGWRGTPMADLADIVSEETHGATTIEGRFLGLYWDATMNRVRLPLHGYAMDDLGPLNDNIRLLGAVRFLEFLVTAPHGSVIDFGTSERNFEPIYASIENQSDSEKSFVTVVLDSAIEGAVQIALGTHPSGVGLDDITPDSVWAAMMQTAHTPRHDELDALKQHVHVASVDHADGGLAMIAPAPKWSSTLPVQWYSRVYDDTMKTRWFQGSLRDWDRHESSHDFAAGVMRLWPFMGPVWCDAP